jgi:non-specific serine/threonine protein kinase
VTDLGIPGIENPVEVGQGGVAVVYRAHQTTFGRDVAVKVLTVAGVDESVRDRFTAECQALGALSHHPNIVTVFDAGLTPARLPYLVMEYLPNGSLDDRIQREGALEPGEALSIGVKVAGALESAHRAGVLHRDVKPANILVSDFGEPLLADFGIARVAGSSRVTATGMVTGTPAHAPPEIFEGQPASRQSDLYSLASTVYTLLSGSSPFNRDTDEDIIALILRVGTEDPPDLRGRGVPDRVALVIERAMSKTPAARPPTVAAFGDELRAVERAIGRVQTRMLVIGDDTGGGKVADLESTRPVSPSPFTPSGGTPQPTTPRPFTPKRAAPAERSAERPAARASGAAGATAAAPAPTPTPTPTPTPPPTGYQTGQQPGYQTGQHSGYQTGQHPGYHTGAYPAAPPEKSNTWILVVVLIALVFIAAVVGGVLIARVTGG